jgi:hypothetical protein
MAKKNPFIESAASAEEVAKLEGKILLQPSQNKITETEENVHSPIVKEITVNKKKKKSLEAPGDDRKWKREKNPLYDMERLINPVYFESGNFTSTQMCEAYGRALKKFAYDKNTSIRDIINIAIFDYGIKEGFLKSAS